MPGSLWRAAAGVERGGQPAGAGAAGRLRRATCGGGSSGNCPPAVPGSGTPGGRGGGRWRQQPSPQWSCWHFWPAAFPGPATSRRTVPPWWRRTRKPASASCWWPSAITWSAPKWCSSSWPMPTPRGRWTSPPNRSGRPIWWEKAASIARRPSTPATAAPPACWTTSTGCCWRLRTRPRRLSGRELQDLRRRLEAEGILFKIRVLDSNVRSQKQGNL